ncbi:MULTISPECIES: hypothetical protein [Methylorubrum]|uniref:hypothetical protein n=1 Tax=Methylorubrum TaxID=2282523 RepID=UPI0020A13BB8|nr:MULTISPECIES: hypothetical protein [Methylorubrum]MCP1551645.1 hypothetical protein [Methylorubrum zatmanii]MCP1556612.1 hypothetical protein [Methylorubrum extorquens]MCP1581980.1 hypothetical protein [Methylorubrum extorquens]
MSRVLTPAEADRRFFQRFTDRRHRVRVAARSEIETASREGRLTAAIPDGYRAHVGVMLLSRGALQFAIGVLAEGADCDMTEREARGAFALLFRQDDAQLIAWAAERNRPQGLTPLPRRNDA